MDNDHGITGELRRFITDPLLGYASQSQHIERLTAIADRIDSAHEKAMREAYAAGRGDGMGMANAKDAQAEYLRGKNDGYDEGWDAGFASADDWLGQHEDAMAEHGWVRLPKDIDDKLIHEHDKIDWRDHAGTWHNNALVVAVCSDGCYVMDGMVFHVHASDIRHHKHPTVEDVLDEFVERWHDTHHDDIPALKAEYAAKLRLADDWKEQ